MTRPDREPVREFLERARARRRLEQPPPELFKAALERLQREELTLAHSRTSGFWRASAPHGLARWLARLGSALELRTVRLGLALALALAVFVSWGARRDAQLSPHQDGPTVALTAEPASRTEQPARDSHSSSTSSVPTPRPILPPGPPQLLAADAGPHPAAPQQARPGKLDCRQPWWIDATGTKRLKMACLSPNPSCEPPWFSDAQGVLRVKPQCSSSANEAEERTQRSKQSERGKKEPAPKGKTKNPAANPVPPGCEPLWFTDPKGIQRLKPNCL